MRIWPFILVFVLSSVSLFGQSFIFPVSENWTVLKEGQPFTFTLDVTESGKPRYSIDGINDYQISLDTLGHFLWTPSFDLVDRLEKQKEITLIFQAEWKNGHRIRKPISFTILHQNRSPAIDELPTFYVKQSTQNQYQISDDYVTDPDGDPIAYKPAVSQLPEGLQFSSQGLITWTPSRNQFNSLKNSPLVLEFTIQDQPEKAETKGRIKVAQTQLDLPPDLLILPGDSVFTLKEDERLNFKIYASDPNGDENINTFGFVSSDSRIAKNSLKESTTAQGEFTWSPGYSFVEEAEKVKLIDLTFFVLDKSANRVERKLKVKVIDAENLDEKDKLLFQKYKNSLITAKALIDRLDENHEVLSKTLKQAKRGKKNRALLNASLGATTGLSPVILSNDPTGYKAVSAIGGTTVLTLGTLEATEVIGKSKNEILDKLKINVEIRNQLQLEGDNFARKYALKSARRDKSFDVDRDKLLPIINNQKLEILELSAGQPAYPKYDIKEIKKTFTDFSEE
jgi:Putative Ig domain